MSSAGEQTNHNFQSQKGPKHLDGSRAPINVEKVNVRATTLIIVHVDTGLRFRIEGDCDANGGLITMNAGSCGIAAFLSLEVYAYRYRTWYCTEAVKHCCTVRSTYVVTMTNSKVQYCTVLFETLR